LTRKMFRKLFFEPRFSLTSCVSYVFGIWFSSILFKVNAREEARPLSKSARHSCKSGVQLQVFFFAVTGLFCSCRSLFQLQVSFAVARLFCSGTSLLQLQVSLTVARLFCSCRSLVCSFDSCSFFFCSHRSLLQSRESLLQFWNSLAVVGRFCSCR